MCTVKCAVLRATRSDQSGVNTEQYKLHRVHFTGHSVLQSIQWMETLDSKHCNVNYEVKSAERANYGVTMECNCG